MKDDFIFRGSWYRAAQNLGADDRLTCYEMIMQYVFEGKEPDPTLYIAKAITSPWIEQIDKDAAAYERKCSTNAANAAARWQRELEPQPPTSGTAPVEEPAPKKLRQRFTPPTVAEVADYCKERGSGIDARQFVDYYTAKGWKVGNASMKDWKAAVRTWDHREHTNAHGNAKTAPQGVKLGVGEYIDRTDGLRHYTPTRTVPMDAPPRPSTSDVWREEKQQWVYIPD